MLRKLSILAMVSGMISFVTSWTWLIININQPSRGYSERINSLHEVLIIIWLVTAWLAIILMLFVFLTRNSISKLDNNPINLRNLSIGALLFVVITPHFLYILGIIVFDIIFSGI